MCDAYNEYKSIRETDDFNDVFLIIAQKFTSQRLL